MSISIKLQAESNKRDFTAPLLQVEGFDLELEILHGRIAKYDREVLLSLLHKAHQHLNPKSAVTAGVDVATVTDDDEDDQFCFFGVGASEEEAAEGKLLSKLLLTHPN